MIVIYSLFVERQGVVRIIWARVQGYSGNGMPDVNPLVRPLAAKKRDPNKIKSVCRYQAEHELEIPKYGQI